MKYFEVTFTAQPCNEIVTDVLYDKPFDLSQIKEDKYHDIIRYYTESDEEHKARRK